MEHYRGPTFDGPAVIMIADGWTRRIFLELLGAGDLPEIADLFEQDAERSGFLDVISNLPTVSLASHTTILTGTHQAEHGVVGHRWLDSATNSRRDYLGVSGPKQVNRDIRRDVPTVFEHYKHAVSVQSVIRRGAQQHVSLPTIRSGPILRKAGDLLVRQPDSLVVAWLPRGDILAHTYGPDSARVRRDMQETSVAIGQLARRLEGSGLLAKTRLLLIPDHGHRAVSQTVNLKRLLRDIGIDTAINRRPTKSNQTLTLTSGDSSALLYLSERDRSRLTVIANQVAQLACVELVCAPVGRDRLLFFSHQGAASATYDWAEGSVSYEVDDGEDPLGLDVGPRSVLNLQSPMLTGKYPDVLHQIARSFASGRSGDLLLLAAAGTHFGRTPRLAFRFGYHRGSHGGPFPDEILVSAGFRLPSGERMPDRSPIRSADLLRALGFLPIGATVASPTTRTLLATSS